MLFRIKNGQVQETPGNAFNVDNAPFKASDWTSLPTDNSAYVKDDGTGTPVMKTDAEIGAIKLPDAQIIQNAAMSAACLAAIVAGFSSSALGTSHTYSCDNEDEANITHANNAAISLWCTDSNGIKKYTAHTLAQGQQVYADMVAHIQNQQATYAVRLTSILEIGSSWVSATSYSVNDIRLEAGTYYKCTIANSDVTFTASNWTAITPDDVVTAIKAVSW